MKIFCGCVVTPLYLTGKYDLGQEPWDINGDTQPVFACGFNNWPLICLWNSSTR